MADKAIRTVVALGASLALSMWATVGLGTPSTAQAAPGAAVFLDSKIHGNPGHNHAIDHDQGRVSATAERVLEKPLPKPKGYVDEFGPAVTNLPTVQVPVEGRAELAAMAVPSAGTWVNGPRIERVVHVFDLPRTMTSDTYMASAGSGNYPAYGTGGAQQRYFGSIYDRTTKTLTPFNLSFDMFCATAVHDENGDIILAGGTGAYPANNKEVSGTWGGLDDSYRYDVSSNQFIRLGNMNYKRWYPEFFKDQASNIHVHGGQHNGVQIAPWEKLARGATTWQVISGLSLAMNSYAAMELIAPNVFAYTGVKSSPTSLSKPPFIIDMGTKRRTTTPGLRDANVRRSAAALPLFPAQDEKVLVVGGGAASGTTGTTLVDLIDYSVWPASVPRFVPRASLQLPTVFPNMVNLPNGQPFLAGGSRAWRTGDILQAAIYDPESDNWTWVAPHRYGRDYHSAMHVNLNGSVSLFGGNPGLNNFQSQVEEYRPWYMDGRPRPALGLASLRAFIPAGDTLPALSKGGSVTIDVTVPSGSSIGRFTLDGARASTHVSSDAGQMMFDLPFTQAGGRYTVTIPNHYKLTLGAYKLTAVTADDVPSVSVWAKVV